MDFEMPSATDLLVAFKDVANSGIELANKYYDTRNAVDTLAFNRQMQSLQLNTASNIAQTQALTAETQAKVALAKAQQPLWDMTGISGLLNSKTRTGSENLMVMLAIVGTGIALFSLMKKG